jgi:hypothetical protein
MSEIKDALIYASITTHRFDETNMRIPTGAKLDAGNAMFFDVDTQTQRYKPDTSRSTAFNNFKKEVGATDPSTAKEYLNKRNPSHN